MFGLNLALFSAPRLLPLPFFEQLGAPLYVWLERASVVVFGVNEFALRVLSLLASCALLPAIWLTGRRLIGPEAGLAALCMAAGMPALVMHAAQAKPYGIDALVTVVLIGLAAAVVREPAARGRWVGLLVAGFIGVMISIPSIFVLGGVVLVLVTSVRGEWKLSLALGSVWGALFALFYFQVYHVEPTSSFNQHFWQAGLLGSPHSFAERVRLITSGLLEPFVFRPGWFWGSLLFTTMLVASAYLIRRARWTAVLILTPVLLNVLASFLRAFPFGGRVSVFTAPLYCLLFGAGVAALASVVVQARRLYATLGLTGLLMLQSARNSVSIAIDPVGLGDSRTVIRTLLQRASPDEPIYLFVRSVPNWVMYSTDWSAPDTARALRLIRAASVLGPNSGNAPARGHPVAAAEADGLRFPFRSSVELLGLPSGIESLDHALPPQIVPDSGWATSEVARMRHEARPRIWVLVSHARKIAERPLMSAVCAEQGRILYQLSRAEAAVYHVSFASNEKDAGAKEPVGVPAAQNLCSEVLARLNARRQQE